MDSSYTDSLYASCVIKLRDLPWKQNARNMGLAVLHSILVEMIEKWDKNYNAFNDDNKIDEIIQVIHEFILFSSSSCTSF